MIPFFDCLASISLCSWYPCFLLGTYLFPVVSSCWDCNSNAQLPLWKLNPSLPLPWYRQDLGTVPKGSQSDPLSRHLQLCVSGEARVGSQGRVVRCMADHSCQPLRLPLVSFWSSCLFEDWVIHLLVTCHQLSFASGSWSWFLLLGAIADAESHISLVLKAYNYIQYSVRNRGEGTLAPGPVL